MALLEPDMQRDVCDLNSAGSVKVSEVCWRTLMSKQHREDEGTADWSVWGVKSYDFIQKDVLACHRPCSEQSNYVQQGSQGEKLSNKNIANG